MTALHPTRPGLAHRLTHTHPTVDLPGAGRVEICQPILGPARAALVTPADGQGGVYLDRPRPVHLSQLGRPVTAAGLRSLADDLAHDLDLIRSVESEKTV